MARIGIIGTGISGMGAAYLLHKSHDVTLYEKSADIGGHTRTKTVQYGDKNIAVDTGFIVFNRQNYPNLCGLFKHLAVPTQKSNMTFGITINNGELEWGAKNINAVFGQRSNLLRPQFLRFIYDIFLFNRSALPMAEANPNLTLSELLKKIGVGDWYARYFILPIGGAIWSCSLSTMLDFPALAFVRFFKDHGLLSVIGQPQWYTVAGGSREYVKRLTAGYKDKILAGTAAVDVKRAGGRVYVTDSTGNTREYDHIILASHADQTLAMLKDATADERSALVAFKYSKNHAVLHKDTTIMPIRKRCWSSWVYHSSGDTARSTIPVTYWMNLLQSIDPNYPLFVTLNPHREIAKELIFDEHEFEHPIYSMEADAAQKRFPDLQGKQNTWFCGAYLRNGFHEDGLTSAVTVAQSLGASIPWL